MSQPETLSRRERQIMDILYRQSRATASDVLAAMEDPPSYSTVRALLRILEDKGHLRHQQDGTRYLYEPALPREHARTSALQRLVTTFFEGSAEQVVAALLDDPGKVSREELDRIATLIEDARQAESRTKRKERAK